MIDADLALLYNVKTKELNKAVARNIERFPQDFMFKLSKEEFENLRFQFGTSSWGGRRYMPYAFTEQGVAMLSSVLNSRRAALVNVAIMRIFVKLRKIISINKEISQKLCALEHKVERHDENIIAIFDAIRQMIKEEEKPKKRIGFI